MYLILSLNILKMYVHKLMYIRNFNFFKFFFFGTNPKLVSKEEDIWLTISRKRVDF